MDKNIFSIAKRIAEYLSGNEDIEGKQELEEWRKEYRNESLLQKITGDSRRRLEQRRYDDFPCQQGWEQLQAKRLRIRRRRLYRRLSGCAALVALFSGLAFFLLMPGEGKENIHFSAVTANIEVGGPKATLILDDGREINLTKQQGVISVPLSSVQNTGHRLTYRPDSLPVQANPVFHELIVPLAGEYQLQLCDGTVVYLNAMSKLRFPNFFSGKVREVELEGEAYFKVSKDTACPFVVKSASCVVYVYGTQFNISAYPDEPEIHTTLVDGKLAVENSYGYRKIKPGEQWRYDKQKEEVTVTSVDVTLYTAWKDGWLKFNDARLEEIMQTVSRWYGVEVSYETEDLKELCFGCNVNRHNSIDPLLRVFEANGKIRIEREGKRLKIRQGR